MNKSARETGYLTFFFGEYKLSLMNFTVIKIPLNKFSCTQY